MHVRAWVVARLLVGFALVPALAGCLVDDEPLDRADLPPPPPSAPPPREWASLEDATIRPGVILHTQARACLTNFFFVHPESSVVYLGTTAYCVRDLPLGSMATVGEGRELATLIYSSYQTMFELGEDDPAALEYNDLAVFYLDEASRHLANPSLPGGGPRELARSDDVQIGDRLRAFAPGPNVPREMEWREAVVAGEAGEWALMTYAILPGAPGTLGGPVVDTDGRAVGVLSTLGVYPNPGANGVARLDTMMAYARENAKMYMELATWDAPTASPET